MNAEHARKRMWSLACVTVALGVGVVGPAHAEAPTEKLQSALKDAVTDAQNKVGVLEPWQKKIFEDEILPQYGRFVRGYRASDAGYQVDVDLELIKRYVQFQAERLLRQRAPKVALYVWADPACGERCQAPVEGIRRILKARTERRGFTTVLLNPADVGGAEVTGADLEAAARAHAESKKYAAIAVLQWTEAAVDPGDTAHAEDRKVAIRSYWVAWMATASNTESSFKPITVEGSVDQAVGDPIDVGCQRLMNEALTSLGEKALQIQLAEAELKAHEMLVAVNGLTDYNQYVRVRTQLADRLNSIGEIEDRILKRGRITFALATDRPGTDIARALLGGPLEGGGRLAVTNVGEHAVEVEVRP